MLPIVDESGYILDGQPRSLCHNGESMMLHPVVHLHVVNSSGHILLQKRSMKKHIQPGKWDTAVGGHVSLGESIDKALDREAFEEIGLDLANSEKKIEKVGQYIFQSAVERELVYSHVVFCPELFSPIIKEFDQIDELRFFSKDEIEMMIAKEQATPNFCKEYKSIILPYLVSHDLG